jgi:rare lipoprotein A
MHKKLLCLLLVVAINSIFATSSGNIKHHHPHKKALHKKRKKTKKQHNNYMYGTATYYGGNDGFEGKRMANGRLFNSDNISIAAHPTLPLGTKLKVNDLSSHRVIYVEVTDRMAKRDKVIDVSKGGAKALGMHRRGTTTVQLTIISNKEFARKKNTVEIEDGDDGSPQ